MLNTNQFNNLFAIEQFQKFVIMKIFKKRKIYMFYFEGNWRMNCKKKKGVGDCKEMNGEMK